ncbi:secretory phospholipase A2 receptor-like, partial [Huso huso]
GGSSGQCFYEGAGKTWQGAQSYCRNQGRDLHTIQDQARVNKLIGLISSISNWYWIGLYRDKENWQWSSGGDVIYTNWEPYLFCASVNSEGEWEDSLCSQRNYFMCYSGGSSGQCFYEGAGKTWQEAQSYCRNQGRDLPTIQDQARVNKLIGLISSISNWYWIGLYRDKENWQWSSGGDVIYTNWEPYLFCASVNSEGEWEDSLCSQRNYFMCYSGELRFNSFVNETADWTGDEARSLDTAQGP